MIKYIPLIALALVIHMLGYYTFLNRIEPFQYFFYLTSWWSYIIIVDATLGMKCGRLTVLNRRLPLLIVLSCAFWCIFELINVRLQNWFYINLPEEERVLRYTGYLLAFGTVVPAIYVTKETVREFLGTMNVRPRSLSHYPLYAITTGVISLVLTLAFPVYCFPLAWVFLPFILDGYNHLKGYPSFMGDLEKGSMVDIVASLVAGLICGILWETWNYWSISKWVYTVPFFDNLKIFEMPVPGYLGFLVFGLATIAFARFVQGAKLCARRISPVIIVALAFLSLTFRFIDMHTVFSYATPLERLSFIEPSKRDHLRSQGVRTSYGIDVTVLSQDERESMSLVHLKGFGYENFVKVRKAGITSIGQLALSDVGTLSSILGVPSHRRVTVFINAARRLQVKDH